MLESWRAPCASDCTKNDDNNNDENAADDAESTSLKHLQNVWVNKWVPVCSFELQQEQELEELEPGLGSRSLAAVVVEARTEGQRFAGRSWRLVVDPAAIVIK